MLPGNTLWRYMRASPLRRAKLPTPVRRTNVRTALLRALVDSLGSRSAAVALRDKVAVGRLVVVVDDPVPSAGVVALVARALSVLHSPFLADAHGLDRGRGSRDRGGREGDCEESLQELHDVDWVGCSRVRLGKVAVLRKGRENGLN